ncbi:uncharacterized protein LOC117176239 [Belonocnema kinseyi]|uniref:uncharacterized protein LOC117176239 n=1 Tax=Belonocnema kinseyi TaxID=2817044 RepID=UPI00143DA5DD|nr:uncharacterized protein LOC117176239 [Belonocnema kinseyi]XP_033222278.1 uncharacterized protein LOC117176239 [Belonocnema kinseyi]
MLSYMLPTVDKPPSGDLNQNIRLGKIQDQNDLRNYSSNSTKTVLNSNRTMNSTILSRFEDGVGDRYHQNQVQGQTVIPIESPKHNAQNGTARKSTLHTSKVSKDDSLYSIDSDASTVGSDRKNKILNGTKHANLKRVSFGSSKGSMVETLVFETPVQEEPENNHFLDNNGRLEHPASMIPVPDTDEGREKVRVSLVGAQPSPATPGVLLLDPIGPSTGHLIDIMAASPAELLTTHTEHTTPTYHTQISTDSGWDNPFRPDGDLSREADEIVELIKGGKPITPTPGQNAPPLPGCEGRKGEHDSSSSPLLDSTTRQGNGNAHSTPSKPVNEKVGSTTSATVEVGRVTAQGPGDASQVEHVTLKKKPKCKCCVLQ